MKNSKKNLKVKNESKKLGETINDVMGKESKNKSRKY